MKKKRKVNKRKVLLVVMVVIILLVGGVVVGKNFLTTSEKKYKKNATNTAQESLEINWAKRAEHRQTHAEKIADYEAMLQTVSLRNREFLSAEEEQQFQTMQTELTYNLLDEYDMELAEQQINTLTYMLDRHSITSGDGDLSYRRGILLANKQFCMPADFVPGVSEQASVAMNEMAAAAAVDGIHIEAFSTYRSYDTQIGLFNRYVASDGEEAANRYSSRPGCSDHQTGMAFDIGSDDKSQWAETTFDGTPAALWLEAHAPEYGFILRYPQGKEDITGYIYESWHYRYVGNIAPRVTASGQTLEEYLELV